LVSTCVFAPGKDSGKQKPLNCCFRYTNLGFGRVSHTGIDETPAATLKAILPPMPVYIAMLRGVNLGGRNKIKMDDLKTMCRSLKLRDPQTYVQSGNVIFGSDEKKPEKLAAMLQARIERGCGFRPEVIMRSSEEMRRAIAANPFAKDKGLEPARFLVTFLPAEVDAETRKQLLDLEIAPDVLRVSGREVFIYFYAGLGRSKSWPRIEKVLKKAGTSRNWNSVTKMLEMAEALESNSKK